MSQEHSKNSTEHNLLDSGAINETDNYPQRGRKSTLRESIRKIANYYDDSTKIMKKVGETDDKELEEDEISRRSTAMNSKKTMPLDTEPAKGLSFSATLFTFIKVNLITGFLFLPKGFAEGGWLFSILNVIAISIFVSYCNIALADCTEVCNSYNFTRIGEIAFGKCGKYMVEYGIAISQILFPCGYANLIASQIDILVQTWTGIDYHIYWFIAVGLAAIFIPMCFIKDVSVFSKLHLLGDLAVASTVITLAVTCSMNLSDDTPVAKPGLDMITSKWAKTLGMTITMLEGVGLVLPIKESMENKKDFPKVVIWGMLIVGIILAGFPMLCYLTFQKGTEEIILKNLDAHQIYIQIVTILFVFSVGVVYPVMLNPAFTILETNFMGKIDSENRSQVIKQRILRTVIVLFTVVVGILSIGQFDTMLSLVGCAICTPIALIFPTIFHWKLYKDTQPKWRSILDLSITILGCLMAATVLIFTLLTW